MMSLSFMISSSSPSILTSVPDHLPNSTTVANLDVEGDQLAGRHVRAGANSNDFALLRLFLCGVGMMMPPAVFVFGIDAANDDAVVQRTELHIVLFPFLASVVPLLSAPGNRRVSERRPRWHSVNESANSALDVGRGRRPVNDFAIRIF
jgi:hypothetical protein